MERDCGHKFLESIGCILVLNKLLFIVGLLLLSACSQEAKPDASTDITTWQGTYYPNGCLSCTNDYVFSQTYDNYGDCRSWAKNKISNLEDKATCNKNCKNPDEYGTQVCEVVVRNWNPEFGDGVTFENYSDQPLKTSVNSSEKIKELDETHNLVQLRTMFDDGVDKLQVDNNEGIKDITIAAEGGLPEAQIMLGFMHIVGNDVPKDITKAIALLEEAAAQDSPMGNSAVIYLGEIYEEGEDVPQDYSKAMSWYRKGVKFGNPLAEQHLGVMYHLGLGTPIDLEEAAKLYQKAASSGNADAQSSIALMYFKGEGVPENYQQAKNYAQLAALQGNGIAQFLMGTLHIGSYGIPTDNVESYAWYSLAKAKGVENTSDILTEFSKIMTAEEISKAQALASEYFKIIQANSQI